MQLLWKHAHIHFPLQVRILALSFQLPKKAPLYSSAPILLASRCSQHLCCCGSPNPLDRSLEIHNQASAWWFKYNYYHVRVKSTSVIKYLAVPSPAPSFPDIPWLTLAILKWEAGGDRYLWDLLQSSPWPHSKRYGTPAESTIWS